MPSSRWQIAPACQVLRLQGVLPARQAHHGGAHHPGAALPGEARDRVLVPRRLGDLQHHLVPLQLAGQAGRVNFPCSGSTSRVPRVAVTGEKEFLEAFKSNTLFEFIRSVTRPLFGDDYDYYCYDCIKALPAPVAVIFYPEPTENHSIRFK